MSNNPAQHKGPMRSESDHVRKASGEQHSKLNHQNTAPLGYRTQPTKSKARGSKVAGA